MVERRVEGASVGGSIPSGSTNLTKEAIMPKKTLGYPDTPLKKQVRPYEETQSAWDVILEHFFDIKREKDNEHR